MLIWLLSDLHLEMSVWDLPAERPDLDVLVVCGDLITRAERGVRWLRDRLPDSDIVYVLGNHERYGTDFAVTLDKAREEAAGSRIRVLENEAVEIGGIEFLGCTLWTDFALFGEDTVGAAMAVAQSRMNDYNAIRTNRYGRKLRAIDTLEAHRDSVSFLRKHCEQHPERRRVIVTHHAVDPVEVPTPLGHELLGAAYVSGDGLDLVAELHPDCWLSGHIHRSVDRVVEGKTRLISNAKGYGPFSSTTPAAWQNRAFDPRFTFEL